MKKPVLALFAAALVCAPAVPEAAAQQNDYQSKGYYAKALDQQKASRQKKNEPSLYGDMTGGTSGGFEEGSVDYSGGGEDSGGGSFNQMMGGSDGDAAGIHAYLRDQELDSSVTGRTQNARQRSAADAQKRRDEMIKKMKANSDKLLRQQKERAWRLSHPGQDYPDEDNDSGWGGDSSAGGEDSGGGWAGAGDDAGGGGGDDGWGSWGGGGADSGGGGDWGGGGGGGDYSSTFVTDPGN